MKRQPSEKQREQLEAMVQMLRNRRKVKHDAGAIPWSEYANPDSPWKGMQIDKAPCDQLDEAR